MATNRTKRPATEVTRSENRPERIPVSGHRNILNVKGVNTDLYTYRWVNDVDDRLDRFKLGGWEFVTDDVKVGERTVDSSKHTESIVSKYVGANRTAYLMRINRAWYEEDQKAKEIALKESEAAMLQSDRNGEGRYGKVSIK